MSIQRLQVGPRYAQAVTHNGVVSLAGQVAADTTADAAGQTAQVLAAIDQLLAEAGTSKARLLTATVYVADIADYAAMNSAWDAWVDRTHPPTRATVEARLAGPDYKVEIVVTAALP